jgi:hypothetical protein
LLYVRPADDGIGRILCDARYDPWVADDDKGPGLPIAGRGRDPARFKKLFDHLVRNRIGPVPANAAPTFQQCHR